MPAKEQTWRDQKLLHIIFGVSALVMMISTLMLLAKDHNREWKSWQLSDRRKEAWMTQAYHDSLADQYSETMRSFAADLRQAQTEPVDPEIIGEFKLIVETEYRRLDDADVRIRRRDFDSLQSALEEFNQEATRVSEIRNRMAEAGDEVPAQLAREFEKAEQDAIAARERLYREMEVFITEALRRERVITGRRKFVAADRTAEVSELGIKRAEGASAEDLATRQERIDGYSQEITRLTEDLAAANLYRTRLESIRADIDSERATLAREKSALEAELERLRDLVRRNTSNVGEWITRWPILNALYDGNVRIDQIWLPDLTINYNFSEPARFDRCKTCHQAITQTVPGTADEPAYVYEHELRLEIATPDSPPDEGASVRDVYGMVLEYGSIIGHEREALVHYVLPNTPAARAGLESGDVILRAGDLPVYEKSTAELYLLQLVNWGEPASLTVRRGFTHPYVSHPRLDLYLTDASPHPELTMGCTVCHDGQGSGTSFQWTSHTPDNADQQDDWIRQYGWFDNHHWIFPMKPARFLESNCLKCHFDKPSLEPSERFPEPPAPKLVEGWTLVEEYGCFGCHEINGYAGADNRIAPDVRLEPNYNEVASQILMDSSLTDEEIEWARTLIQSPENRSVRHRLLEVVRQDRQLASRAETRDEARFSEETHGLTESLMDVEVPGSYRKVGPSLRYLNSKVDFEWLYDWLADPTHFRPSTKMPKFFGLWEHLQEDQEELALSEKYEPVEIRAIAEYLLAISQDFEYLTPSDEVTEEPSAERGKWLFESRGCLACHTHEEFPGIAADQGPDLSRVGAKLEGDKGASWLYSWIKQPHHYHVRTKMPDVYLDPIVEKDTNNQPTGVVTDPAADIVAYLLGSTGDWQLEAPPQRGWSAEEQDALSDLAVEWLSSDTIPPARAREYVKSGIPSHLEPRLTSDERLLVDLTEENRVDRLQSFVARRTISKYGCFGCHDVPGFEDAKPIGTSLAGWGRKDNAMLAFENIELFLSGVGHPHGPQHAHGGGGHHLNAGDFVQDGISYFIQQIVSHSRDGFLWQKLRMPRSYDYKVTKNKSYNERLLMPLFPFDDEQREAIMTFVLGLTSEPPSPQLVYQPDARQQAIIEGRQVLERFNCAACHTMEMEQWQVNFEEDTFGSPDDVVDFPFLERHFTSNEIAESQIVDNRGRLQATFHGMPVLNEETGLPELVDEDGVPLEPEDIGELEPFYEFTLWRDTLINGETWLRGQQRPMIPAHPTDYGPADGQAFPAWGGELARYLYPRVIEKAREVNPQVNAPEAWGWLPPPLMEEGKKVQNEWLHEFLMDPTKLRPASVMRMPNFHMSSDEAAKLVNYFAASSDAKFPYEYTPNRRGSYLASQEANNPERLQQAMNIVVDGNYCVKCHAVQDFEPQGDVATFGPSLSEVHSRLRADYLRDWIANPVRILPYTGMPVNIPYRPQDPHLGGVSQDLFQGTSIEQVRGIVDLLLNFDHFAKRQTTITPMVEAAAEREAAEDEDTEDAPDE